MFSWAPPASSSGMRTTYPGNRATVVKGTIRPPEYTREQHLESYLQDDTLKRSTRRVSSDDTTYDTVFQTTDQQALMLRVHLNSSNFPTMILIHVHATHPWLDSKMNVVGYPNIQSEENWKNARQLLGKAVFEVVRHLQTNPPQVLEVTDTSLKNLQARLGSKTPAAPQASSSRLSTTESYHDSSANIPRVDMPQIPSTFPVVDAMNTSELQHLLDDHIDFLNFLHQEIPVFRELQSMRSTVLEDNVVAAEKNLELEDELKDLHESCTRLQSSLKEKLDDFQSLKEKQDKIAAPPDQRGLLKQLNTLKKQALEESEEMADDWLDDGAENPKLFFKAFLEKRKLHHVRAAKMELLQRQQSMASF